jgi:hypothetical protein
MIAIHFGKQLAGSMFDEVQEWAIECEMSIEDATSDCYKYMMWSLSEVNNNWQSHFDIMFSDILKCLVQAPVISYSVTNYEGLKTPTLIVHGNYLNERYTGKKHLINNELIHKFGEAFEFEFGLEYLGFEHIHHKVGLSIAPFKNDRRSRPRNSVIYLIGEKPHYYDGKRFFPIVA